ncbi:ATP-grasp domain-containing protein [Serratia bockelmannii]|uniref:ATP-grasp domain-containing protein n=1 Tax=Serratia bockelmannii TaxID=2703793 RepID=UPI00313C1CAE
MGAKKYLLVLDYLPIRINELVSIKKYAKEKYSLEMVIISERLSGEERKFFDYIYHLPVSNHNYQDEVLNIIQKIDMQCVCILPFMDAVSGHAAVIAKKMGLYGDNAELSFAGVDKLRFREQESILKEFLDAQCIAIPRYREIISYDQLVDFFKLCPSGIVIKPTDGRANIGVKVIKNFEELEESYRSTCQVTANSKIIAEELIDFDSEFSYDGVGVLSFLTQKVSQKGEYPVELGQIVPAQCSATQALALTKAGQCINLISGQRYGAFHNEIKLNTSTGGTFLVETNRRPAGMRIWDMANKVYGVSLQHIWVDHLVQGYSNTRCMTPIGSAFLINLLSPKDGVISREVNIEDVKEKTISLVNESFAKLNYEIIGVKINIKENSMVYKTPKTNNDFCGYVCVYINESDVNHQELMSSIVSAWKKMIMKYIH